MPIVRLGTGSVGLRGTLLPLTLTGNRVQGRSLILTLDRGRS